MRKIRNIVLFIILIMLLISSYGATVFSGKFQLEIYNNGESLLRKQYRIKTSTLMAVLFKYGGNFYKFYINNKDNQRVKDFSCINDDIQKDIQKVIDKEEKPMINSEIIWDKKKAEFVYNEGENGIIVNRNKLIEILYKEFDANTVFTLPTKEIPQEITIEDLKKRTFERASFNTAYGHSKSNRKHNIELATSKINGVIIPAESKLSFNKIVGPRTIANGFKAAGIISGGTFVEGVGGGVCQVSTTLYNAWVRAGLGVINAINHSLPVSYISPSLDAMVSSKNDLLLYNNTPYNIYIKAITKDNKIYITVYGFYTEEKVVLRTQILKTIPCYEYDIIEKHIDWKENEIFRVISKPKNGLVSVCYKDIYKNGELIKSEKFRTNTYSPQKGKLVRKPVLNPEEEEEEENQIMDPAYSTLFTIVPWRVSVTE